MARILVIDDSPTAAATVRKAVAELGHEVQELASIVDLPTHLYDDPPDLILLDLVMPAMPGESVGPFIKRYQIRDTPVLIHSARPRSALLAAAEKVGAAGIVEKGKPASELCRIIDETLGKWASDTIEDQGRSRP